jgi:hypothetical protein
LGLLLHILKKLLALLSPGTQPLPFCRAQLQLSGRNVFGLLAGAQVLKNQKTEGCHRNPTNN